MTHWLEDYTAVYDVEPDDPMCRFVSSAAELDDLISYTDHEGKQERGGVWAIRLGREDVERLLLHGEVLVISTDDNQYLAVVADGRRRSG